MIIEKSPSTVGVWRATQRVCTGNILKGTFKVEELFTSGSSPTGALNRMFELLEWKDIGNWVYKSQSDLEVENQNYIDQNIGLLRELFVDMGEYDGVPIIEDNFEDLFDKWLASHKQEQLIATIDDIKQHGKE